MRLLITRPLEDAEKLAGVLAGLGHSSIVAPLMAVRFHDGSPINLDGVQGVLATSANGVRALVRRTPRRDITVYAVGPQTAEVARSAGFAPVRNAGGDANALASLLIARGSPIQGRLLHAAGEETAGHMKETLEANGFTVETVVLYGVEAAVSFPESAVKVMREGALDGVLLFSPRSARIFATLLSSEGLAHACARLTAFCISEATANGLGSLSFGRVAIAEAPNQQAVLDLLAG